MRQRKKVELRIFTWNLLLDRLKKPYAPHFPYRAGAMAHTLQNVQADLLLFQEAGPLSLGLLRHTLTGQEAVVTNSAIPEDPSPQGELMAIFFSPRRFTLVQKGHFWLSDTPDKPSRSFAWPYPQLCQWVRLEEKHTRQRLLAANTHFGHGAATRQKSAALLAATLAPLSQGGPWLVGGDFNTRPGDGAFAPLAQAGLARPETTLGVAPRRTLHVFGLPLVAVDALWFSPHFAPSSISRVTGRRGVLYGSDHFGLLAQTALP